MNFENITLIEINHKYKKDKHPDPTYMGCCTSQNHERHKVPKWLPGGWEEDRMGHYCLMRTRRKELREWTVVMVARQRQYI